MNRQSFNTRYIVATIFLLAGESLANGDSNPSSWVKENTAKSEELLCYRRIGDDQFFIARADGKVKTGYLIDVTNAADIPKTYVFSWRFIDENGKSLETNTPPKGVKQGYINSGGKTFAESVAYRNLHLEAAKRVVVAVELKRYVDKSNSPNNLDQFAREQGIQKFSICNISTAP
jgi:hypothetical protein